MSRVKLAHIYILLKGLGVDTKREEVTELVSLLDEGYNSINQFVASDIQLNKLKERVRELEYSLAQSLQKNDESDQFQLKKQLQIKEREINRLKRSLNHANKQLSVKLKDNKQLDSIPEPEKIDASEEKEISRLMDRSDILLRNYELIEIANEQHIYIQKLKAMINTISKSDDVAEFVTSNEEILNLYMQKQKANQIKRRA